MKVSKLLAIIRLVTLLTALSVAPSMAGGSIGWEDVRPQIVKEDAFMAKFIAEQFDVSPVGSGLLIGKHIEVDPEWKPFRLPPFEFTAKPKGAEGEPTLHLTLEPVEGDVWTVTVRKRTKND